MFGAAQRYVSCGGALSASGGLSRKTGAQPIRVARPLCGKGIHRGVVPREVGADLVLRLHARLHLHACNHVEAERIHCSLLACALLWLHQNASMCNAAALATHAYDLVADGSMLTTASVYGVPRLLHTPICLSEHVGT